MSKAFQKTDQVAALLSRRLNVLFPLRLPPALLLQFMHDCHARLVEAKRRIRVPDAEDAARLLPVCPALVDDAEYLL